MDLPDPAAGTPGPPAELVLVGYFDERPGYAVQRARGTRSWLFTWTTAGRGRLRQGGAEVEAGPADLVVLGPDLAHQYAVAPGAGRWAFWWAHCQVRTAWLPWLAPYQVSERMFVTSGVPDAVHASVDAAFRRLHADARWSGQGAPPPPASGPGGRAGDVRAGEQGAIRTAAAAGSVGRELAIAGVERVLLLATGAASASTPTAGDPVDPRVRRVEARIAADPAEPHTVASLAARVALSPSRLAHLFVAQTGRTPMRAVRDARLRHAARLLDSTDLPVERVAAASGFVSAFHFSRVFRARFGVPPSRYRQTHGQPP